MSVSCESLQAAIQDGHQECQVKADEDTADNKGPSRGVNSSFRAAVDRSYENALETDSVSASGKESYAEQQRVQVIYRRF